jgi:spore germination protein GerM
MNKDDKLVTAINEYKKVSKETDINIHNKKYSLIVDRIGVARRSLGSDLDIKTSIIHQDDKKVIVQCDVYVDEKHLSTGTAEELRATSRINQTSALDNAETSAVGRALAFLGFANDSIASAEEVSLAIEQQDRQLQTALSELEKVSHSGNYQAWISKHKSMLQKVKSNNPIAYGKFQERFTELKHQLDTKGVLSNGR